MSNKEYITVTFPKALAKKVSYKNKNGEDKNSYMVKFPYRSKYQDYVWFINEDWVHVSEFNEGFLFVGMKPDFEVTVRKSVKDETTEKFILEDEQVVKPDVLREEMRVL